MLCGGIVCVYATNNNEKVASIFKEGKRVLNLRDYQYFVCLSKSIIS